MQYTYLYVYCGTYYTDWIIIVHSSEGKLAKYQCAKEESEKGTYVDILFPAYRMWSEHVRMCVGMI